MVYQFGCSFITELVNLSGQTIIAREIKKYILSVFLSLKLSQVLGKKVEQLFQIEETD